MDIQIIQSYLTADYKIFGFMKKRQICLLLIRKKTLREKLSKIILLILKK